jgi:mannitol-1-phosphate 5-dehydrogenase
MARALIIGGGAIGRGFLPWALDGFELDYFDESIELIFRMNRNGGYSSYMSINGKLKEKFIRPNASSSHLRDFDLASYDIAFVAVGPRNSSKLPVDLSRLKCPIYSLENDPSSVDILKTQYFLDRVYFGVPDVITSCTASPEHVALDPLAVHTEDGVLYLEDSPDVPDELKSTLSSAQWVPAQQLRREWDAKLYLHNTPHCVAAYLGYLADCEYLHEGLNVPFIRRTVEGVIEEMLLALKLATTHEHDFMERYALKELRRFSNNQLFDPISRVAREPLRKLQPDGRLTGALKLAMLTGVAPLNLMAGISAALNYLDPEDSDYPFIRLLDVFGVKAFLFYHLSIPPDSLESRYIDMNFETTRQYLARNLPWTS